MVCDECVPKKKNTFMRARFTLKQNEAERVEHLTTIHCMPRRLR